MKKILKLNALIFASLLLAVSFEFFKAAWAIQIDGVTPSGQIKTVGVTDNHSLQVSVTNPSGGITPSTTTVTGQTVVVAGNAPVVIYPADVSRQQGCIHNDSALTTFQPVWLGVAVVTNNTGLELDPGAAYCPDNPASMTGAIYGFIPAGSPNATISFIYHKQ